MIYLILFFNSLRFFGLETSPPGFYADESYGATQVICLAQTGADFFDNFLPLFAISGPGEPIYTPAYLYGQLLWTSIFGYSIASFRAFPALASSLTVLFLFLYTRNISDKKNALYVSLIASIMPWAFQFSRIAWDPPLAPMFLMMGLWISTLTRFWWLAGISYALSIYSYPPLRIITPLLLIFLPFYPVKKKLIIFGVISFFCIPLALELEKDNFITRSNMLSIWSSAFYNPYRHFSLGQLVKVFFSNWFVHFSPKFLFLHGENNLRHSIQTYGMLSWLDFSAILGLIFLFILKKFKAINSMLTLSQYRLIITSLFGIVISIIPAALTNEASPHALRAITAWPFYAIFTGTVLFRFEQLIHLKRLFYRCILVMSFTFFNLYIYDYFFRYPYLAKEAFESGYSNEILYPRLVKNEINCEELRVQAKKMDRNTRIGEPIYFSQNGKGPITNYLNAHWYDREEWGIWSDGKNADLLIPPPLGNPKKIAFNLNALITPSHPVQQLEIWLEGRMMKRLLLQHSNNNLVDIPLPEDINTQKLLSIEFRTPNSVSPKEANISTNDNRILGIGLVSLEFQ